MVFNGVQKDMQTCGGHFQGVKRRLRLKAKTLMFVNCSPASSNLDETFMRLSVALSMDILESSLLLIVRFMGSVLVFSFLTLMCRCHSSVFQMSRPKERKNAMPEGFPKLHT